MNTKKYSFILFCMLVPLMIWSQQPNILFIMTDDLGYSDLSCYGSEIKTPAIDQLAENGALFTRCYVSPMCVTTRVALMSGMEFMAAGGNNFPNGISFAELLRDAGYSTSLIGKNHGMPDLRIGDPEKDFGFDHFFGFTGGQLNSFTGEGNVHWQLDGKLFPYTDLPDDFYTTNSFTDYAISFMREAIDRDKAFFTFLAYNAPHTPLDAPETNVRKYYDPENGINVYENGWEEMRKERLERMKKLGIIDGNVQLPKSGVEVPDWDLLPDTSLYEWEIQKQFECLSRSAYAGMVDNIDENVSRIMAFLNDPNGDGNTEDNVINNTLVIFLSDNGGCYAGLHTNRQALPWSQENRGAGFTTNYGWATLSNTPFRYYKHASHEGAIRSPLILHWPEGLEHPKGAILHDMVRIWDFYPTFLELAGIAYPDLPAEKKELMGKSFLPLLKGERYDDPDFFVPVFSRSRGIIKDNWKLVNYYDSPFELYDLRNDPSEIHDLADIRPGLVSELSEYWNTYAEFHDFADNKEWNRPLGEKKRGWGYDFMHPGLSSTEPEYMSVDVALDTKLSLKFKGKISFQNTENKFIRLQKYGEPGVVLWSADPDISSKYEGKTEITFPGFPLLDPDSHYNISWDAGWVKVDQNGRMTDMYPVQESAYSFRFKTVEDSTESRLNKLSKQKEELRLAKRSTGNFGDSKLVEIDNQIYVLATLDGSLQIKKFGPQDSSFRLTSPRISSNWIAVINDNNSLLCLTASFEDKSLRLYRIDINSLKATLITKPQANEHLLIDPTLINANGVYYLSYTQIQGNVNNADTSKQNGHYEVFFMKSGDLKHWENVSSIVAKNRNIEDGSLYYDEEVHTFYFLYEEEIFDKHKSFIKIKQSGDSGGTWTDETTLSPAIADQEPAELLREKDKWYLFYSSDIRSPGSSYYGAEAYMSVFSGTDFSPEKSNRTIHAEKGIILFDVKQNKANVHFLAAKLKANGNELIEYTWKMAADR